MLKSGLLERHVITQPRPGRVDEISHHGIQRQKLIGNPLGSNAYPPIGYPLKQVLGIKVGEVIYL